MFDRKKKSSKKKKKKKKKKIQKTSESIGEKAPEDKQGRLMVWRETNLKLASKNRLGESWMIFCGKEFNKTNKIEKNRSKKNNQKPQPPKTNLHHQFATNQPQNSG